VYFSQVESVAEVLFLKGLRVIPWLEHSVRLQVLTDPFSFQLRLG